MSWLGQPPEVPLRLVVVLLHLCLTAEVLGTVQYCAITSPRFSGQPCEVSLRDACTAFLVVCPLTWVLVVIGNLALVLWVLLVFPWYIYMVDPVTNPGEATLEMQRSYFCIFLVRFLAGSN